MYKIIQSLKTNKGCGLDGILCKLLKEGVPIVKPSLTFIINVSIKSGVFPDDWKIAKVFPVYKEDSKSYRLLVK